MKAKGLMMMLFLLVGLSGIGQTIRNGQVIAVVPLGNQNYSIINETGTENYYKTSPLEIGELRPEQSVELHFSGNNSNSAQVVTPSLTSNLFCHLIQNNGSNSPILLFLSEMPTLENDILFFEDTTQIRIFYDVVASIITQSNKEMDEMLDLVEQQFPGFLSYRTWFNTEYDWLNGSFTLEEIERISTKDFLNDEIIKTMLNSEKFIGIGDSVYYFHAQNIQIGVHKDYSRGILTLSALPDEYDPYGAGSIVLVDSAMKLISPLYDNGNGPKGVAQVTDSLKYTSDPYWHNVNCDIHTKQLRLEVWEFFTNTNGIQQIDTHYNAGTLTIDWNDGSIEVINNYNGEWVSHYYGLTGQTYKPKTTFEFNDRNGDTQTLEDGENTDGKIISIHVEFACTDADNEEPGFMVSGEWMMTNKLWVKHNFWGKHIGSYTHFWKQNNSGTWERHKADIYTSVNGKFRDDNCVGIEPKLGSDLKHLQKKVQVTKHKLFKRYDISNGDIKSHHYFVKGSLFLQLDLVLNPC